MLCCNKVSLVGGNYTLTLTLNDHFLVRFGITNRIARTAAA